MPISTEALVLENRHIGEHGEPTLCSAFKILKKQWDNGDRDREIGLHLLFLCWYGNVEPPFLTGFFNSPESDSLMATFSEVFDYFQRDIDDDAEVLFVVGIAARLFPWALGDEKLWERRADEYRIRYWELMPNGIDPEVFLNRGYYGEYYFGHADGNSFALNE